MDDVNILKLSKKEHTEFSYDKNGNMVAKGHHRHEEKHDSEHHDNDDNHQDNDHHDGNGWSYTYDFENRLIKAEQGNTVVTLKYDPLGRRIEKKVAKRDKKDDDVTYTYVYDGQAIILEYETTGDGRHKMAEVTKYVHGPGIDEPLAMTRDNEVYFYHADGLGSVVALTDKKQNVVEVYEYDSFGNLKGNVKPMQTFTYTGRIFDVETKLLDYRARTYDPSLGRFIQKDPISIYSNMYNNQYMYVENNVVNKVDPTGLYGEDVHFGLTNKLALMIGIPSEIASQIARADQNVDDNFWTSPLNPLGIIFHFQTSKYALVGLEQSLASGDINQFGKFLHVMQDTYSHKGWSAACGGHVMSNFGTTKSMLETDIYNDSNPRDIYMGKETEYWLNRFKNRFIK